MRVTASDERSVPHELALETTFTSEPILVDNRKPEMRRPRHEVPVRLGPGARRPEPPRRDGIPIDGGDWQILSATDGICDDLVEAFTIKLPKLAPGPHAVAVRAWDSADNVGAAAASRIRLPGK